MYNTGNQYQLNILSAGHGHPDHHFALLFSLPLFSTRPSLTLILSSSKDTILTVLLMLMYSMLLQSTVSYTVPAIAIEHKAQALAWPWHHALFCTCTCTVLVPAQCTILRSILCSMHVYQYPYPVRSLLAPTIDS